MIPGIGVLQAITSSFHKGMNDTKVTDSNSKTEDNILLNKSSSSSRDKLSFNAPPFYPRNALPNNLSLKDMKALNLKATDLRFDSSMMESSSKNIIENMGTKASDYDSNFQLEEEQTSLFGEDTSVLVHDEGVPEDAHFIELEEKIQKGTDKGKKRGRKKRGNQKIRGYGILFLGSHMAQNREGAQIGFICYTMQGRRKGNLTADFSYCILNF